MDDRWPLHRFRASIARSDLRPAMRDGLIALCDVAIAAHVATTDRPSDIAGAVAHPETCAIWVELDDVGSPLAKIGACDCGLAALVEKLAQFTFDQETADGSQDRPEPDAASAPAPQP